MSHEVRVAAAHFGCCCFVVMWLWLWVAGLGAGGMEC